jgi:hypothetical protein
VYAGDHKELSIELLAPRAQRPRRPWVTLFRRRVLAVDGGVGDLALTHRPRTLDVLLEALLAHAYRPMSITDIARVLRWSLTRAQQSARTPHAAPSHNRPRNPPRAP